MAPPGAAAHPSNTPPASAAVSVYRAVIAARTAMEAHGCPLSSRSRSMWWYLASKVNRAGTCDASNASIARVIGVEPDAVRKYRRELEAFGALVTDDQVHGRGRTNAYRLMLAAVADTGPHGPVSVANTGPHGPVSVERNRSTRTENRSTRTAHIGEVVEEVEESFNRDDTAPERARTAYANYAAGMRAMGATPLPPGAYWMAHAADGPDVWAESG